MTALMMIAASFVLNVPDESNLLILLLRSAAAAAISHGFVAMVQSLTAEQYLPRFFLVTTMFGWPAYAVLFRLMFDKLSNDEPLQIWLVLGSSAESRLMTACSGAGLLGAVAFVNSPCDLQGSLLTSRTRKELPQVLVYESLESESEVFRRNILFLRNEGVRIRSVSDFFEDFLDKVSLKDVHLDDLASDVREIHNIPYRRISRLIDVIAGLALGLGLLLVTPLIYLGNFFGNRGPLFFRQPRIGQAGHQFEILKFRTMKESAAPSNWTSVGDSRVTPFGRLLRASHIDELPQAVNIIRGELAIVGPRPEQPQYVDLLRREIPFYDQRHAVRPGLTGWAQVNYPYGASVDDARQKLEFDLYYVRHQSLRLDLRILAKTLKQVLTLKGR